MKNNNTSIINPERLVSQPTHLFNGEPVKLFMSTARGNHVTGEIMDGESKGKYTTVELDKAERICGLEDGRFSSCYKCKDCREHYD